MNTCKLSEGPVGGRVLPIAGAAVLAAALTVSPLQAAHADTVTPPPVPTNIEVPPGNIAFLLGHGVGTQNYVCLPSGSGFAWSLFTPEATLFSDQLRQLTTHFFGPNPFEKGTVRAVWQHSVDTSTVWGQAIAQSTDPNFVTPGAIPWLLVRVVGAKNGPGGDFGLRRGVLTATTFIQRLNTVGGSAPTTDCSLATDVGKKAFVPYTADYFFYSPLTDDTHTTN
jgi:hypothetical protein